MAERRGRRFWERVVAEAERGNASHAQVASRHGVRLTTLRSWVYALRREQRALVSTKPPVRVLPVEIVQTPPRGRSIEIRVASGETVTFDEGTDVAYLAVLVVALRSNEC